jgi:toxin ParE1/3/4
LKVFCTDAAVSHLVAIREYIARDSPRYALAMIDRITRRSAQIGEFPLSGGQVPEFNRGDVREVVENPYRIICRVKDEQVDVLAVIHGARKMPVDLRSS